MHSLLPPPTPKTPALLVKLPRHVVDSLHTVAADQLRLALGGKERVTTGTLFVGAAQHDVRYSSERSSAPPLVFQGRTARATSDGGWAQWAQRGRVVGKLTVVYRGKPAGAAPAEARHRAPATPATPAKLPATPARVSSDAAAAKTVPQKKPGIFRHNREMLRDRVLHMLARGPMDEAKIVDEISSPHGVVLEVLGALASKSGAAWSLLPGRFRFVQIESWPKYDLQTRLRVADNALQAFDTLGLPADHSDRARVRLIQQRLAQGESALSPSGEPTSASPSAPSRDPPRDPLRDPLRDPQTPKKKPVRSVIAPTLPKKPRVPGPGVSGVQSTPVSAGTQSDAGAKDSGRLNGRPASLAAVSAADAVVASTRRPMGSTPNSAPNTAVGGFDTVRHAPTSDPDADAEPERGARPRRRSSPPVRSRSRTPPPPAAADRPADRPANRPAMASDTASDKPGHRRVRSRPFQLQASPGLRGGTHEAETGAAVSRVQERLAQLGDRRISGSPAGGRSRSSSDLPQGAPRRARGPSLSPIADRRPSPSPPPPPSPQAETVEDLQELQRQLVSSYAEYSQLRLRIDSRCAAFAPLAEELAAAQAACTAALQARRARDVDREEGEEDPGDQRAGSAELGSHATTSKLGPDGSRLYWREVGGKSWLADSPDAIVGQTVGRDGQPCRTQQLLPEEARVLHATQAIAALYSEMDCDDARRWVRRYMRLHAHIERMDGGLAAAYQRIAAALNAQYDGLRADLGDSVVDAALARPGDEPVPRVLTLDMYRDDDATHGSAAAVPQ